MLAEILLMWVAIIVAWLNGANNAGNVVGIIVGSRIMPLEKALKYVTLFDFLGAITMGNFLMRAMSSTITRVELLSREEATVLYLGVMLPVALWMYLATNLKIPVSINQAVVSGVTAYLAFSGHFEKINAIALLIVIASWLFVPFLAMFFAFIILKIVDATTRKVKERGLVALSLIFSALFIALITTIILLKLGLFAIHAALLISAFIGLGGGILVASRIGKIITSNPLIARRKTFNEMAKISSLLMAFSHGAHDVANTATPIYFALDSLAGEMHLPFFGETMSLASLSIAATALSLGILTWGYRVTGTIASGITPVRSDTGFVAQVATSVSIITLTIAGVPSSSSLAIVGALAGTGISRRSRVNFRNLTRIFSLWAITPLVVAAMTIGVSIGLNILLPFH